MGNQTQVLRMFCITKLSTLILLLSACARYHHQLGILLQTNYRLWTHKPHRQHPYHLYLLVLWMSRTPWMEMIQPFPLPRHRRSIHLQAEYHQSTLHL